MQRNKRKLALIGSLLISIPLAYGPAYAAKTLDLTNKNVSVLQPFVLAPHAAIQNAIALEEVSRHVDFKQTLHVRVKETYAGYPVLGGEAIIHIKNGANTSKSLVSVMAAAKQKKSSLDGTIYNDLKSDLAKTPGYVFRQKQSQKAKQTAADMWQNKHQ